MAKKIDVKKIREAAGLSIQQMADLAGVNQSTVWRWETGEVTLSALARTFILSLDKGGK